MKILEGILGFAFTYLIIFYGLPKAHDLARKGALFKIDKGLSSSVKFTESLTCKKLDSKMRVISIKDCK